jgi:hypothetical protein
MLIVLEKKVSVILPPEDKMVIKVSTSRFAVVYMRRAVILALRHLALRGTVQRGCCLGRQSSYHSEWPFIGVSIVVLIERSMLLRSARTRVGQ